MAHTASILHGVSAALLLTAGVFAAPSAPVFNIGREDGRADEFALAKGLGWQRYMAAFPQPIAYTVGVSRAETGWPYIHPNTADRWAGSRTHPFIIHFTLTAAPPRPLFLIIAQINALQDPTLHLAVNGHALEPQRVPPGSGDASGSAAGRAKPARTVVTVPAHFFRTGANELALTLDAGSWIIYDAVTLAADLPPAYTPPDLASRAQALRDGMYGAVREILFATRNHVNDGHWYANFGYYCDGPARTTYGGRGRLCAWDLRTGALRLLVDDPAGAVRDPCVHEDGTKIVFAYRPGGTPHYHLYEIHADGSGLRQLTDGGYDDIEPCYLPDGGIVFVSSRARRWVNCWLTQVATVHRCEADGSRIRMLSANIEHDNTPAVLPDGRILYMRWEYIDRSQVEYHHLWTMNPDGTGVNVYFGNMHSWTVMIDALPVPGTQEVIASFSPGHGANEHEGFATLVSQQHGPDVQDAAVRIKHIGRIRDPYPVTRDLFLVAKGKSIAFLTRDGKEETILTDPATPVHEPRVLRPRPREPVIPSRVTSGTPNGQFVLLDVYEGRNMEGVKRGDIKKLLVLEALPKPVNFSGGMDLTSWSGTFNLERVLGTVPVEEDGSASFLAPAGRPLFFVALDADDLSVKRMQSFADLMPGETFTCIGCHETRSSAAEARRDAATPLALQRSPSVIQPFEDLPDVPDFQRDIQPILDRHCVTCHNPQKRAGTLNLAAARAPRFSNAYVALLARRQVADGANGLGNRPPRTIGSSASPLLARLSGGHHAVKVSPREWRMVWLWIEAAAPYAGSYAALRNTEEQRYYGHAGNKIFGECRDVFKRRCAECHKNTAEQNVSGFPFNWGVRRDKEKKKLGRPTGSHERIILPDDPARFYDAGVLVDYTRPACSSLLLAPLAKSAGGAGRCAREVFKDTRDPDYKKILASIESGKKLYDARPPWGAPGWRPNPQYVREMKRFGVLPAAFDPEADTLDPFATDQAYWRSLWPAP